jgi:hypothetical protein
VLPLSALKIQRRERERERQYIYLQKKSVLSQVVVAKEMRISGG